MNLTKILDKLCKKITTEIAVLNNGVAVSIELTNVATLNDGDNFIQEKSSMILSVVNIEEDKTLKNQSLYKEYSGNGSSIEKYKKPAQNLILSLLFTSYNKDQAKYAEGLDKLEYIIKCLQYNNVFYYDTTNLFEQTEVSENQAKSMNKIILDLVSLKPEHLNQMWSYLGSRYMPSVLYSMRMIRIQNENSLPTDPVINNAKAQLWTNDKSDITGEIEASSFLLD
ncbi:MULTISPECIES: DUF4255 domain-containing protein [Flavobacterium]|uniref:DUF4255 domain-containing protein n=1 Tax=Flavobacterium TaxID=237 RepID=UPI00188D8043|nr:MULTISPECIES: DUF4255 domain-containing protein [Flavobacterium]MBF4471636.1 DUF4255 domain-containing protein [Flavobacterium sp. HJJ]